MNLSSHSVTSNNYLNNNSFSKFSTLMDYLVKKLEIRVKNFQTIRAAINNIFDIQDLVENKKEMIKHFYEAEDDVKQGLDAFKALLSQNRDLSENLEIAQVKINQYDIKLQSDLKIMNELNDRNNNLLSENNFLKESLNELENNHSYFMERIAYLESELKLKEKEIDELASINNNQQQRIEKLDEENVLLRMQVENLNIKNSNFNNIQTESDYQNSNVGNDSNKKYTAGNNSVGNKSIEYDNVKSILSERENNKKLINDRIKTHFSFENERNETEENQLNTNDDNTESNNLNINETVTFKNLNSQSSQYNSRKSSPKNFQFSMSSPNKETNLYDNENDNLLKKSNISTDSKKMKNKGESVSNLVLKALESPENINLLNDKYGNDFMQKLLSKDVTDEFINEIELLLKTGRKKNISDDKKRLHSYSNNNFNNNLNIPDKENKDNSTYKFDELSPLNTEESRKQNNNNTNMNANMTNQNLNSNSNNLLSSSRMNRSIVSEKSAKFSKTNSKSLNRSHSSGILYKKIETGNNSNFEKSLRSYGENNYSSKKFINYTNPYGNYFDSSIKKGEKSLNILKK
jgi:hypothetical protein